MSETDVPAIDGKVRQVAELLPFPVELDADMGGTFSLQIDLGGRGGVDDPPDRAGIDPDDSNARWWVDIEGGGKTYISELSLDADPHDVAAWIAATALAENSPATITDTAPGRAAAIVKASYPSNITTPITASTGRAVPVAKTERHHGRSAR